MSDNGPTGRAIETVKTVFELASESPELAEAGRSFAKSALTISKAVNNALLPIAAVNFGFEKARTYFNERFAKDMEEAAKDIPPDEIVEPRSSVAAPTLEGLAFAHDEPALKGMYLKLLRTAMDGRTAGSAHPGFAQVIRQIDSLDAQLFNSLSHETSYPVVTLRIQLDGGGFDEAQKHIVGALRGGQPFASPMVQTSIDNLERLGLVSIDYSFYFKAPERYEWVETRPEYLRLKEAGKEVDVGKGILELTAFGRMFKQAVS